jgi:hypothetical protein
MKNEHGLIPYFLIYLQPAVYITSSAEKEYTAVQTFIGERETDLAFVKGELLTVLLQRYQLKPFCICNQRIALPLKLNC